MPPQPLPQSPLSPSALPQCHTTYLDIEGYYDFVAILVLIFLASILLRKSLRNSKYLSEQLVLGCQLDHQKSIERRLWVNRVQIIFLVFLMSSQIMLIGLFFMVREHRQFVLKHKLNKVYRLSQIVVIVLINALNLTVGYLYWNAAKEYYSTLIRHPPCLFRNWIQNVFLMNLMLNLGPIVVSIYCIISDQLDQVYINIAALVPISTSILMLIGFREYYRYKILVEIQTSEKVMCEEKKYSLCLFLSCLLRIVQYTLDIFGVYYPTLIKSFNPDCIDVWPFNALLTLVLGLCVTLLPSFVYSHLFRSPRDRYNPLFSS